ncbi:Gfo/Idh/MocA family oxidoreductase [Arthrobacter agilis]|uniref:Gfo/Idh/MocA family protein n=1 Tax=Arthrobacter agilis TaxID=37921 RepID=UPI000B34D8BF|nr:Gfo/Idh/MocA family oxidoreductase [Arthrobacter agilis]OUM43565.1 dehydrogenase [Arthrobacter agilis]PPB47639.1 gfo/Idh/MocA family oxidoreductase [Arthrobacter agilis]TPV24812.1 Gfo/Idh/MocA family oxidoreductase [Arthrobacter agilis]WDF33552.1 Gfo/Idh/MocA family oxidoreductase [Arthrobacter agilis]VDR30955.1 1,5-anhydro-D-fructose reductase [Arthrobacter agilis]
MTSTSPAALRVGMVGYAFMGAMHSHAWRTAPRFFDLPLQPELAVLAGRDAAAVKTAADTFGWRDTETDWRALIERDDVDLIDICTPGNTHAEIAIAALEAGKHVLCEKPLANSVEEAERMTAAAREAEARGVFAMCGFSYRRTPALTLARRLVEQGRLGTVRHVRAQYLQDWLSDETSPMTWRLDREKSGSGALGDIGAHSIDAAQYVTGLQISGVSGLLNTFVHERPLSGARSGLGGSGAADSGMGQVTVDDAAIFSARFDGGAIGAFEATRFALGRKNSMRLEVNGTLGSLAFDFEHMNSLEFYDGTQPQETAGFSTINVTEPVHPYTGNWWPAGHGLGYEHGFTHQVVDLVQAIADARTPSPSFEDALQVQKVLRAVERSSAEDAGWQHV